MRPIRPGDRGPAVEDIQRRLRSLGYDLGPTGIDGVFLGRTLSAVQSFQAAHELAEDGLVGDATWAALVDSTFTLGDRTLYLRMPYFHGRDVHELQQALNILGFAVGTDDAIFGSFTERAVREFQRNTGLHADGIVGFETVSALSSLRHVWEGKEIGAHSAARSGPARALDVLTRRQVALRADTPYAADVAGRIVNLALAGSDQAHIGLVPRGHEVPADTDVLVCLVSQDEAPRDGLPITRLDGGDDDAMARVATAIEAAEHGCHEVVVELQTPPGDDDRAAQRAAVTLLDALCLALA